MHAEVWGVCMRRFGVCACGGGGEAKRITGEGRCACNGRNELVDGHGFDYAGVRTTTRAVADGEAAGAHEWPLAPRHPPVTDEAGVQSHSAMGLRRLYQGAEAATPRGTKRVEERSRRELTISLGSGRQQTQPRKLNG